MTWHICKKCKRKTGELFDGFCVSCYFNDVIKRHTPEGREYERSHSLVR